MSQFTEMCCDLKGLDRQQPYLTENPLSSVTFRRYNASIFRAAFLWSDPAKLLFDVSGAAITPSKGFSALIRFLFLLEYVYVHRLTCIVKH